MSDIASKLEQRRESVGGCAQATKKQLLARRGSRVVSAAVIHVYTMGGCEVWRHHGGEYFEQEVRS